MCTQQLTAKTAPPVTIDCEIDAMKKIRTHGWQQGSCSDILCQIHTE